MESRRIAHRSLASTRPDLRRPLAPEGLELRVLLSATPDNPAPYFAMPTAPFGEFANWCPRCAATSDGIDPTSAELPREKLATDKEFDNGFSTSAGNTERERERAPSPWLVKLTVVVARDNDQDKDDAPIHDVAGESSESALENSEWFEGHSSDQLAPDVANRPYDGWAHADQAIPKEAARLWHNRRLPTQLAPGDRAGTLAALPSQSVRTNDLGSGTSFPSLGGAERVSANGNSGSELVRSEIGRLLGGSPDLTPAIMQALGVRELSASSLRPQSGQLADSAWVFQAAQHQAPLAISSARAIPLLSSLAQSADGMNLAMHRNDPHRASTLPDNHLAARRSPSRDVRLEALDQWFSLGLWDTDDEGTFRRRLGQVVGEEEESANEPSTDREASDESRPSDLPRGERAVELSTEKPPHVRSEQDAIGRVRWHERLDPGSAADAQHFGGSIVWAASPGVPRSDFGPAISGWVVDAVSARRESWRSVEPATQVGAAQAFHVHLSDEALPSAAETNANSTPPAATPTNRDLGERTFEPTVETPARGALVWLPLFSLLGRLHARRAGRTSQGSGENRNADEDPNV